MKRLGLTPLSLAATLFLGAGLGAEEAKPTAQALNLPPAEASRESGPDRAKEMMRSLVGSGDAKLDEAAYAEMLKEQTSRQATAATAERSPGRAEPAGAKMLELFDKNGDGVLDEAEQAVARKYASQHTPVPVNNPAALVKRFDKDGDGKLNVEEVATMMQSLRGARAFDVASAKPTSEDELKRLKAVAAEVARRRELREAVAKQMQAK